MVHNLQVLLIKFHIHLLWEDLFIIFLFFVLGSALIVRLYDLFGGFESLLVFNFSSMD